MSERKLRFRIRRGNFEVELEGEFDYVKEKFEDLMAQTPSAAGIGQPQPGASTLDILAESTTAESLEGILEATPEGKLHFVIPFDRISAKEAIGLMLYRAHPAPLPDDELIQLLSTSWRAIKDNVARARISELRKEGRLIPNDGRYSLSGAGVQWITNQVLPRLKQQQTSP